MRVAREGKRADKRARAPAGFQGAVVLSCAPHHMGDLCRISTGSHPVQNAGIGLKVRPVVISELIGHGRLREISHLLCLLFRPSGPIAKEIWS